MSEQVAEMLAQALSSNSGQRALSCLRNDVASKESIARTQDVLSEQISSRAAESTPNGLQIGDVVRSTSADRFTTRNHGALVVSDILRTPHFDKEECVEVDVVVVWATDIRDGKTIALESLRDSRQLVKLSPAELANLWSENETPVEKVDVEVN